MQIGFDDGEPILVSTLDPGTEFEAFETQMIPPGLATPYTQQWTLNTQWEFRTNWLFELGYVGTKGTKLLTAINANQPLDIDTIGFLPRPGVPGGGFIGNYYTIVNDQFVNLRTPPSGCDLTDDPGECTISAELRGALLGLDEDEGANTLFSNANSIYHSLQTGLTKRYSRGVLANVNYTFSRSLDTYSDEGKYQVEHDQTRPYLNRALSDFHRKHRLIMSWTWDLPFRGNRFADGWQISGVGTFQSGRPFSIIDGDFSGFLFASQNPRPNLAPGATHEDLVTEGSVTLADQQLPEPGRSGDFGGSIRQPGAQRSHWSGPAPSGCERIETDALDRTDLAGVSHRGVQHLEHAVVSQSRAQHRECVVRPDHQDSGRPASDSVRPQAAVLTGAPLMAAYGWNRFTQRTNTSRTQRHEAISIIFAKRGVLGAYLGRRNRTSCVHLLKPRSKVANAED